MDTKKPTWAEIMDGWEKAGEGYYLVECSVTQERKVFKGFEGLAHFLSLRRMYGNAAAKVTALDKDKAKVLFGDEIKD